MKLLTNIWTITATDVRTERNENVMAINDHGKQGRHGLLGRHRKKF